MGSEFVQLAGLLRGAALSKQESHIFLSFSFLLSHVSPFDLLLPMHPCLSRDFGATPAGEIASKGGRKSGSSS